VDQFSPLSEKLRAGQSLQWSPDGTRIALAVTLFGSREDLPIFRPTLLILDVATGREIFRFEGVHVVGSASWSPDGNRILVADSDDVVRILDLTTQELSPVPFLPGPRKEAWEREAKVRDIVGLYLNPPEKAVVLCVDEKSQIQALDRTAPMLPLRPGLPASRTHDYVRHTATTLFAALEVATGKVTDACYDRHRHDEFLRFLRQVAKAYPRVKLHVVADNYATHKHPAIRAWLAKNPRITMHFTPTSGSWMNLVEVFFGIITRQAIRRGTFTSVADLEAAIGTYIDAWNERCEPFNWVKDADTILAKATRPKVTNTQDTSVTRH